VASLSIEQVHALSAPNQGVVAACPGSAHLLAYAASCFVVVYDSNSRRQLLQLRSTTSNHALHCVAWSLEGDHLAAGEAGSNAGIHVWNLHGKGQCVQTLKGHKATVGALCFSPDGGWWARAPVCTQGPRARLPQPPDRNHPQNAM
jgi:WD40 repeat protein